ncbi:WD repeat-containing protein 35 isoform X1 [Dermacentor albipictus]|uniref:WD repeat-containing protein 35 isoform X1 n=1 Tax=Dermacentor albipictus TaxID=60249 RepID=UPI0038FBF863
MFIYLSKKIAIPNNTRIQCLAWNREHGYIACGGDNGLLKVLKLETEKDGKVRGLAAPSNLSMNQTLEGHSGVVQVVAWNSQFQKLTSSDQNGLIIVWMLYKGSWYEEMINNRNKSLVRGMAWNADGQKICIVYDDGAVIVGSVDGNRIWGKELKNLHLHLVEWSPDGKFLLFGMQNGEVHVYEQGGNPVSKIPLPLLHGSGGTKLIGVHWYSRCMPEPGCPVLAIGYDNGKVQLMSNESDDSPLVLDTDMVATCLQWNHDGSMLAVTGKSYGSESEKRNMVKFFNPYGQYLHTLKVPGKEITACAWEGMGLRIALAVDSFIFFANIRPDYKWCFLANTVAYAFNKADRIESTVIFWNTNTNEKYVKYIKHLQKMCAMGEFCTIATREDGNSPKYALIVCNSIGTPVDSITTEVEPLHLSMTESHVFSASRDQIFVWRFQTPRGRTVLELSGQRSKPVLERVIHINEAPTEGENSDDVDKIYEAKKKHQFQVNTDPICCLAASEKMFIVGRESGTFQRYSMPQLMLVQKYAISCRPNKIALNCTSSRMSVIDITGCLLLYDLEARSSEGEQLTFERRDVWDVKWAKDNSELFVLMEKTRMYVFRNLDPEEPVMSSGYICSFSNLEIRTVLLDEIMQDPENPRQEFVCNMEAKSLRDSRDLLAKVGIEEATQFIEDNSHPRLWQLLAEAALQRMDFQTAETAFVRCRDYQGIQFVKHIATLPNEDIRKAEVKAYFKQFDDAEKIYLEIDRRDLAVSLRKMLGDWFRVVQLLKSGNSGTDDRQLEEAWNAIGDYYADRHKWDNAITYYKQGHNHGRLAQAYFAMEDYNGLENLMKSLPEGQPLLNDIGSMFGSVGMCNQAVEAYKKCNEVKAAIDTCVSLNEWNTAIELAKEFNVREIDTLLAQYARRLLDEGKILSAVELYRKANRFRDAAQLMFKVAAEESKKNHAPSLMKKIYVLGATLVEEHRMLSRKTSRTTGSTKGTKEASLALNALMSDDAKGAGTFQPLDQPWRGAEAFHFYLLAQRQLHEGFVDAAMRTALNLREYEDILDGSEIYALLALTSCANRSFGTCSKAFAKLESLTTLTADERQAFQQLAVDIFTKHSRNDSRNVKNECPNCESTVSEWTSTCSSCGSKLPVCVATSRVLKDPSQQWTCPLCRHSAYKQDVLHRHSCPLCHAPKTSVA